MGDGYATVLGDIRRLVRAAVRRAGGREVDARGDEVFAVFAEAPSALQAAIAIQRAMRDADWPDGRDVRLRIGLHRGRPALTETGYVGLAVHAAARIGFAAHGGQIVLSAAVRAAVAESLPEPMALFGLQAPDLPADFRPLRGATAASIQ